MAITGTDRGTGNHNTSATSFTLNPGSNFTAGSMAVLVLAADNAGTGGAVSTITVTDTLGNTWTRRQSPVYDPVGASAGVEGAIFETPMNGGPLQTGTTITVTFSVATTAKAWTLMEVTPTAGFSIRYVTGGVGTGSATTTPTVTSSSITNGNMIIGALFNEQGTGQTVTQDGDTTNGNWSTQQTNEVGTTAAGITVSSQRKIVTASATQTFNPTLGTSSDVILGWIELTEDAHLPASLTEQTEPDAEEDTWDDTPWTALPIAATLVTAAAGIMALCASYVSYELEAQTEDSFVSAQMPDPAITHTASGSPTITKPTATGVAERIIESLGSPSISKPTATGAAERIVKSSGAPSITKPTSAGVAAVTGTETASGSPSITKPTATGATILTRHASGTPSITKPTSSGVAERVVKASGSPSITKPTSTGAATVTAAGPPPVQSSYESLPEVEIPQYYVQIVTLAPHIDLVTSSGAPSIKKPTASGVAFKVDLTYILPAIIDDQVFVPWSDESFVGSQTFNDDAASLDVDFGGDDIVEVSLPESWVSFVPLATGTGKTSSGAPSITKPTATGIAERIVKALGTPSITKPTSSGAANVIGTVSASGSPSITKPTAAGVVERIVKASGSPSITKPTSAGSVRSGRHASGSPSIKKPTSTAVTKLVRHASGAVSITKPTAAGTGQVAGVINANGSPSITKPTATGSMHLVRHASGAPAITKPTSAGVAEDVIKASGAPSITKPTASGVAEREISCTGAVSITKPTSVGVLHLTRRSSGAVSIKKPTVEGVAKAGTFASGSPSIKKPVAYGIALINPDEYVDRQIIGLSEVREVDGLAESRELGGVVAGNEIVVS